MSHYSLAKLRGGAVRFIIGKLGSALATFFAFAFIARTLGVERYGVYASLVAGLEFGLMLGSLGIDWVTGRYLPDYRLHAGRAAFLRFLACVGLIQLAGLLVVALLAYACADLLQAQLGIAASLYGLYACLLVFEGLSRLVRDQFLPLLLAQAWSQGATFLRASLLLGAVLLVRQQSGEADVLFLIVTAEVSSSLASLGLGLCGLWQMLRSQQTAPTLTAEGMTAVWAAPGWRQWGRLALQGYANSLLVFPASGASLTLVVAFVLGAPAAAALGFARTLVDQIRRFLPIEMFLGLIRPAVVSRYLASRDFAALNRQMGLIFLVSVAVALPGVAILSGAASTVALTLGGPRFESAGPILAVWCLSMLLFAHRRTIEVVANTVDRAGASVQGALVLALSPALLAAGLAVGLALPWALLLPLLADLGFSGAVARALHRAGFAYRLPWRTLSGLLACLLATTLTVISALTALPLPVGPAQLVAVVCLATACGWGLLLWFKPFAPDDRAAINSVLPRPWFPF